MMKRFFVGLAMAASMVLTAPATAQTGQTAINLCTGAVGQPYEQAGQMIARLAAGSRIIRVNVVSDTGGTWGNIERTVLGQPNDPGSCHAFIGQPDGHVFLQRTNRAAATALNRVADLHREYLHVVCSRESGVTKLEQIASNPTRYSVALGNRGSGAWLTWQNFVEMDKRLAEVPTRPESGAVALAAVATNRTTCTLIPAGLHGTTMLQANSQFGDKIVLVEATASAFAAARTPDGKPLYTWAKIPSGTYRNLQSGWFSSAVDTVSWEAGLYVNADRIPNERALAEFITIVMRARPEINAAFTK